MSGPALASLLPEKPIDLRRADETWHAVALPHTWGYHVLNNLAGRNGAVLHDPAARHLVWFIEPGGADGWPDAHQMAVKLYQAGDSLTVPGLTGYRDGSRWLRTPTEKLLFTDPVVLRGVIEEVAGPLADAEQLGPIEVCCYCNTTTREPVLVKSWTSYSNGAIYNTYTCPPCGSDPARVGDGGRGPGDTVMSAGPQVMMFVGGRRI